MTSYATTPDYELRTGVDVPVEMIATIQARLDDTAALIELYLGDCADEVYLKYPDVLTALTVSHTFRISVVPPGVRSESVGSTSVSYADSSNDMELSRAETDLLNNLIEGACGASAGVAGVGTLGATWGGPLTGDHWARYVDLWVL